MKAAAAFVLFLTACATPQQRAAHAVETFGPACQAYGFHPGTAAYAACIQRAANDDQARRSAAAAVLLRRPTPPITCQSSSVGAMTTTSCQ